LLKIFELPYETVKELDILGQRLQSLKTKMPIFGILRLKSKPRKLKIFSFFTASTGSPSNFNKTPIGKVLALL